MKVGLDCSNGSAFAIAKSVYDALGAKTYVINCEPDGTNINTNCGSTQMCIRDRSGACAVAAAVSRAVMEDADVYSILQAGLYGAKEGERIGREVARDVAGPSVVKRMEMAIDIGLGRGTPWEKMIEIGHRIGAGLHVAEAIPSAFGFFAANDGDAMGSDVYKRQIR